VRNDLILPTVVVFPRRFGGFANRADCALRRRFATIMLGVAATRQHILVILLAAFHLRVSRRYASLVACAPSVVLTLQFSLAAAVTLCTFLAHWAHWNCQRWQRHELHSL